MGQHTELYNNSTPTQTFPQSELVVDWELSFGENTRININWVGGGAAPEFPLKEGDWICFLQVVPLPSYVGLIKKVVSNVANPWVEVMEPHGLSDLSKPIYVIKNSTAFKDVTWMIASGQSALPAPGVINNIEYEDGASFGGAGFQDNNFEPFTVGSRGTKVYFTGIY
jgi:hypothetical protein